MTGEHKIKASALRKIFGNDAMVIGNFGRTGTSRSAQGPKSRVFHFSARMCSSCNGSRTQGPDREFDAFHALVASQMVEGRDPSSVFLSPQYKVDTKSYLNVFRYFAKILCCHVAESHGPRPLDVCNFAIGRTQRNIVFLSIGADPTYQAYAKAVGEHKFAGHGGLTVPFDPATLSLTSFKSSLTLGAVRYTFWVKFESEVAIELRANHPEFAAKCETACQEALINRPPD